MAKLCSRI